MSAAVSPREPHPLLREVRAARATARRVLGWHLLLRFVVAAVLAFAIAAAVDFAIRPRATSVRFALTAAVVAACVAVLTRGRRAIQAIDWNDVPLARRLEQSLPSPRPELATAVEFLTTRRAVGSASLRSAVVERTWESVRRVDLRELVDRSALKPWTMLAAGVVVTAAIVGGVFPHHARSAWLRLAAPWQTQRWPQRNALEFVDPPARVAAGNDVVWTVVDRNGPLPATVELIVRDKDSLVRRVPMQIAEGRATATLANVREAFEVRAQGGDDDSLPWLRVEVVPPPRLANWQLTVYSADAAVPPRVALPPVQIRQGSRLEIAGRAESGVAAVRVRFGATVVAGALAADGSFQLPAAGEWSPGESGVWELEALDAAGVVGRQASIQIERIPNRPPVIVWESPVDGDVVSEQGRLRIRGVVSDDARVRRVKLLVDDALEILLSEATADRVSVNSLVPASRFDADPMRRQVALRLVAEDTDGDESRTPPRQITLLSAARMQERLLRDVTEWTAKLAEITRGQREIQSAATGTELPPGIESRQRQVAAELIDPAEGLLRRVRDGLQTWDDNQLEARSAVDAWRLAAERLTALTARSLPEAIDALGELRKQNSAEARTAVTTSQDELVAAFERILADVSAEARSLNLEREFAKLAREQRTLRTRTDEARLSAIVATVDAAEFRRLRTEQTELAREADRLHQALVDAANNPRRTAAAEVCRRRAIGVRMREAASVMETAAENALTIQDEVAAGIEEILQALRGGEDGGAESADVWAARLKSLAEWERRQTTALQAWRDTIDDAASAKAFAAAEAALAKELSDAGGAWKSRTESAARRKLADAADLLRAAGKAANEATPREGLTKGIAAEAAIQDARRELIAAIERVRQEQVRKEAARLAEIVRGFIARQERIVSQTLLVFALEPDGPQSRTKLAERQAVAADQATLAGEIGAAGAASSPLYRLVLLEAARPATQAARRLDQNDAGVDTRRLQQDALTILRQLERALDDDSATETVEEEKPAPQKPEEQQPAAMRSAAELRLVLERQQSLLKQTTNTARRYPPTSPVVRETGAELGPQQGRLAELVEGWAKERGDKSSPPPEPLAENATAADWEDRVSSSLIDGEDIGAENESLFVRIAERMRLAEIGLAGGKLNEPTQKLQQAIVQHLEVLVAQAGKQKKGGGSKSEAGQGSKSTQTGGEPTGAAANDSTGRKPSHAAPQFDPRQMEHMLRSVWGNLPEKTREDLRQTTAEEFLPEYERLIIDYYRRLADETPGAP